MSSTLTKDDVTAMQKKISAMPNYAMWALLKAASEVAAEHNSDEKAVHFMHRALKSYKENAEMSALDSKMNATLEKHLKGDDLENVHSFVAKRKDFVAQLANGSAPLESAKKCLKALDTIYGLRHKLVENEPHLEEEYGKLFNFAKGLVQMIKKY